MRVKSPPSFSLRYTIVVLLALVVGLCVSARAQDDPPAQAGRLSGLVGDVSIQPAGSDAFGQAYPNLPLGPGDRIVTSDYARAEIQIGRTWARIGPNSDVTLVEADPDHITFGVGGGSVRIHCLGLWDGQMLYVQTPSGSSTISQPANFRVDVDPVQNFALFTDHGGLLYISGANDYGVEMHTGVALQLVGSNPVYPQWLQEAYPDDLDNWSMQRDGVIAGASSYRYVSPEINGADELDAAGDWMPQSDYGPVWFPHVDAGWAPYRHGRWINRPPWGWTWVEEEPWGAAPFHYGRWVNVNNRWGWIPGPPAAHPIWSPALVVFAGGGPGVSAWFPLGPGEAYRPWYHTSPGYVDQINITNITPAPRVVVQRTYVNIVNVTNVTYVNRSVGVTAVRQEDFAAGHPVARAAVHVDTVAMGRGPVLAAPPVDIRRAAVIAAPVAHPVHVAAARPVLINEHGAAVSAKPHAQPAPPPVKQVAAPKPVPGRKVVAQPPDAKVMPPSQHLTASGKPNPTPAHPMPANGTPVMAIPPKSGGLPSAPSKPAPPAQPVPANGKPVMAIPPKSGGLPSAPSKPAPPPAKAPTPAPKPAPAAPPKPVTAPEAKPAPPAAKTAPAAKTPAKPDDHKKPKKDEPPKPE